MSRESSEINLDYPQFQKISLSSSSQPRVTTSEKTSSFKATISKNVNNGLLEDPKKSSLSSSQPSKILNQGPEITEDGSPINQERPPRILTLNPPLTSKHQQQIKDEKTIVKVASSVPAPKKKPSRQKESKWYSTSNDKYGDYKECTNYLRYGYCRFGSKCRYEHPDVDQFTVESETLEGAESELSKDKPKINTDHHKKTSNKKNRPCHFFKGPRSCSKGDECEFSHIFPRRYQNFSETPRKYPPVLEVSEEENNEICKTFSRYGRCRFGNSCRFTHKSKNEIGTAKSQETALKNPETFLLENSKVLELITEKNSSSDATDVKKPQDDTEKSIQVKKNVIKPSKPSLYIDDLSEEDLKNLCKDEIFWVKKRFQKKIISENGNSFEVYFYPSDREWPFEVKFIELCIEIPEEYPKEICSINCLNKDGTLPVILLRHINKTMKDWLLLKFEASKNLKKVELLLRPFCKWLDRNLQDIFIEGLKKVKKDLEAKAAGIEFVPCEDILEMSQKEFENFNEETLPNDTTPPDSSEENNESNPPVKPPRADFPMFTPKRGTEIKLRNLELTDQAGTLSCRKLALTLQCGRCRFRSDIITPPNRLNKIICSRCHHNQQATFRPQLLHQFLAVLGYLDLEECSIIDIPLSKCNFSIGCLNCNRSVDAEGLQFGQKQNIWCLYCNSKMGIKIESVKFQYLQLAPIITGTAKELKLGKIIRKVHDPAIQEGKPLPDSGACKHYKKSFRWLRFPCCGKAYPCDLCHDEKETDHEMKRANRMICGFCAKEQPYTNGKDCISCLSSMNRKTGTHWEGGKGCRDKVKMSREDKQKYRGVSKIISKKAQLAKAEVWEKVF